VGQFFAELGAEVIKVESLKTQGDVTRTWKISGEKEERPVGVFLFGQLGKEVLPLIYPNPKEKRLYKP